MFLHHIAACVLIGGGYYYQYDKLICVSLFFHDCADILLEGAKVLNYTGFTQLRYIPFTLLVPVWGIPRLVLFAYHIMSQSFHVWLHQSEQYPMMGMFLAFQCAIYVMVLCYRHRSPNLCLCLGWSLVLPNLANGRARADGPSH